MAFRILFVSVKSYFCYLTVWWPVVCIDLGNCHQQLHNTAGALLPLSATFSLPTFLVTFAESESFLLLLKYATHFGKMFQNKTTK